jgi:hypothetical protein
MMQDVRWWLTMRGCLRIEIAKNAKLSLAFILIVSCYPLRRRYKNNEQDG